MNRQKVNTKSISNNIPAILLILGLMTVAIVLISELFFSNHPNDAQQDTGGNNAPDLFHKEKINLAIDEVLIQNNVRRGWISQAGGRKTIRIPGDIPLLKVCKDVVNRVQESNGQILKSYEEIRTGEIILEIGYNGRIIQTLKFVHDNRLKPQVGKIAIIIDDFGYSYTKVTQNFIELEYPITISILPGLEKSQRIAEAALINRKEIMVHLPMESQVEPTTDNGYTIFTNMDNNEIQRRVENAIQHLSSATGLNNHQGSKATVNKRVVTAMLKIVDKYKLFFIDSRTAKASLAFEITEQLGIPSAKRDVFLDNRDEPDYIRKQVRRLARVASKKGRAVGIGHVRANTYQVLSEELPRLVKLGYQIIPASEIVQ